jgi:hypothetical protein
MTGINRIAPAAGSLPENYQEVLYWKLTKKLIRVIGLQLLSIPLFVISSVVFWGLAINLGKLPEIIKFGLPEIGVFVAAILMTLILHELTHGLVMKMFGAAPQYGVLWKQLMFYATSPGFVYRRNAYIAIALAPLTLLSFLVVVGMWLLSGTLWVPLLGVCAVINASGAIGDLWMTILVLRYAPTAYIMDERDGIRVFTLPS